MAHRVDLNNFAKQIVNEAVAILCDTSFESSRAAFARISNLAQKGEIMAIHLREEERKALREVKLEGIKDA